MSLSPTHIATAVLLPPAHELVRAAAELNHQAGYSSVWSLGQRDGMRRAADTLATLATLANATDSTTVEVLANA